MSKFQLNAKSAAVIVCISGILFGLIGPFNRKLGELGFGTFEVSFYRSLVTLISFGIVMLIVDRTMFRIKKEHILMMLALGVCKGIMDITFIQSQTEISLSLSTVLQMTAPYFLILFGVFIFKQKVTMRKITAVVIGSIAACLISNVFINPGSVNTMGVILGLISGITFAGYLTFSSVMLKNGYSPITILFYAFIIVALMTVPATPMIHSLPTFTDHPETIFFVLGIGVICTALPTLLNVTGIKYIDVTVVTVLSMLEIAVSAIFGAAVYGEDMNLLMIVGMCLLLVSMLLINEKKQDDGDSGNDGTS